MQLSYLLCAVSRRDALRVLLVLGLPSLPSPEAFWVTGATPVICVVDLGWFLDGAKHIGTSFVITSNCECQYCVVPILLLLLCCRVRFKL